jgi:hypothetical protein
VPFGNFDAAEAAWGDDGFRDGMAGVRRQFGADEAAFQVAFRN